MDYLKAPKQINLRAKEGSQYPDLKFIQIDVSPQHVTYQFDMSEVLNLHDKSRSKPVSSRFSRS